MFKSVLLFNEVSWGYSPSLHLIVDERNEVSETSGALENKDWQLFLKAIKYEFRRVEVTLNEYGDQGQLHRYGRRLPRDFPVNLRLFFLFPRTQTGEYPVDIKKIHKIIKILLQQQITMIKTAL